MKTALCHFLLHLFGFDLNFNTDEHQKISFATSTFQAFFGPSSRFNSSTVNMKSDLPVRFSVVSNRNVDRQMILDCNLMLLQCYIYEEHNLKYRRDKIKKY